MQRTSFLVLGCLFFFGCGGDDTTQVPDASNAKDTGTADQSVSDSSTPDATANDAGLDATGFDVVVPDASFACKDPSTCDGGFCCADLVLGAGQPPNCPISSISSACKSTCATKLAFSCGVTETVRFCAKPADCTEQANPKCCEFNQGNQTVTFCASNAVANFATKCL
jgi:hypothetical protein